jgi:hypothetical protein
MLLVAHGTTSLFQSMRTNGLTFSSLPYGVKGLKLMPHQQTPTPASGSATRSRFSETTIQDCSTEPFKERAIRSLNFHKDFSKHDWQCFIELNGSGYVSMFGDSEHSVGMPPSLSELNADTSRSSSISWLRQLNSLKLAGHYTRAVRFDLIVFNNVRRLLVPSTFNRFRGNASPL